MKIAPLILTIFLSGLSFNGLRAGSAEESSPPVILKVDAAAAPRPALKYTLVYEKLDQVPGNAAIAYQRVTRLLTNSEDWKEQSEPASEWLNKPSDEFPLDAATELVGQHAATLEQLVKATRYERCDWETPIRQEGVNTLLPHLSETRALAKLLALEIRVRIHQGRFDEAIRNLRAGFTMAKHLGDGDTLIEGLVGLAVANLMADRVQELIAQPGAPNLYWALSDLPPDYLNLWQATRWERSFLYIHLPVLWEARSRTVSAEDLRSAMVEFQRLSGSVASVPWLSDDETAALTAAGAGWLVYPRAVRYLSELGHSSTEIERMTPANAVVTYIGTAYAVQRDDLFKWFALPYAEARAGLAQAEANLTRERQRDPVGSILPSLLLPALSRAAARYSQFDRHLAMLRILEALRLHAAEHHGALPTSLSAVDEVPVPVDPMTAQTFHYRKDGPTAFLETPPIPSSPKFAMRFEISLRP